MVEMVKYAATGRRKSAIARVNIAPGSGKILVNKRPFEELASYLIMEMTFPFGAFLMTGTGIIPEEAFSLSAGDKVTIAIDTLIQENRVEA